MKYTYQQLEEIRERARALGLEAQFDGPKRDDLGEPFLVVVMPEVVNSLSYFTALGRLTTVQAWGDVSSSAAEIEAIHGVLTAERGWFDVSTEAAP